MLVLQKDRSTHGFCALFVILTFFGFFNFLPPLIMGLTTKSKVMKLCSLACVGLTIASIVFLVIGSENMTDTIATTVASLLIAAYVASFVPTVIYMGKYNRHCDIINTVKYYRINIDVVQEGQYSNYIEPTPTNQIFIKEFQKIYGKKGMAILGAIYYVIRREEALAIEKLKKRRQKSRERKRRSNLP